MVDRPALRHGLSSRAVMAASTALNEFECSRLIAYNAFLQALRTEVNRKRTRVLVHVRDLSQT
jgi:hypothetical protein